MLKWGELISIYGEGSLLCTENLPFWYTSGTHRKNASLRLAKCTKTRTKIKVPKLDKGDEFWYTINMPTPEKKKKLLKAKIAVALNNELGRVPTEK
jgi:hypothetical protein